MAILESRSPQVPARGRRGRHDRPRRRLLLPLLALLIVAMAAVTAVVVAQVVERRYGARTQVVYDVGDVASQPQADRLLATQVVVIGSRAVLGPVAEAYGLSTRELSRRVEVELLEESQVIEVNVAAPDEATAVAMAGGIVDGYLEVAQVEAPARVTEQIERLGGELDALAARRVQVESELAGTDEEAAEERSGLLIEHEALAARMEAWQAELLALELQAVGGSSAWVLTPAYPLEEPLGVGGREALAVGTIAGIFLAAATVLGLRRLRRGDT